MWILYLIATSGTAFLSKINRICASRKANPQLFDYFEYIELRAGYLVRLLTLHGRALFRTAAGN